MNPQSGSDEFISDPASFPLLGAMQQAITSGEPSFSRNGNYGNTAGRLYVEGEATRSVFLHPRGVTDAQGRIEYFSLYVSVDYILQMIGLKEREGENTNNAG